MARLTFGSAFLGIFNRAKANPRETVGTGGTAVFGGYVLENEKNPKLIGRQKYITFSEIIANIAIVGAGLRYYSNLISKASWRVEPDEDGGSQAQEYADLIEEMMYDMTTPWHRVVRRAAMYRMYGFSVQEWTAKRRKDGLIGMLDVESRPQSTIEKWDLDESGTVAGVVQVSPQDQREIYLPRSKIIHIVDDVINDSPEGFGIFRQLVESAQRLSNYQRLEGFGFETDLRGVPLGRGPFSLLQKMVEEGKITSEQKATLEEPLKKFITNHVKNPALGLMLDSATYLSQDAAASPSGIYQWGLDLMQGSAPSLAEVAAAIERVNREMARLLGVEHLLLGSTEGSYALSRDKTHNFALIIDSSLEEISETYDADYVRPIARMNGWDEALMPALRTESIRFKDVEQVTAAIRDLAQAGAPLAPDDEAINEIRDLVGLSHVDLERAAEDAMVRQQAMTEALAAGAGKTPPGEEEDLAPAEIGKYSDDQLHDEGEQELRE